MFREDYPSSGGGGWEPPEPEEVVIIPWFVILQWIKVAIGTVAALALFLATCVTWSYTP
jgi:hypothetical protein